MKLEIKVLNSMRLTKLLIAASRWLSKYADVLNDLNVYPVPDGDTGTNMSMTLQAVENELVKLNHEPNMKELVEIVSEAILLGARGNSGTILSQIIQGFLSSIEDKEEVTVNDVIKAFSTAKERAYQAVSEPVEGTMLTVIRRVAEEAAMYQGDKNDFILFLVYLKNVAKEAVEETPNLLPKLKEAGVVDAGGKGIFYVLEGFEKSVTDPEMLKDLERIVQSQAKRKERMEYTLQEPQDIKFRYCTEFIIEEGTFDLEGYKKEISTFGDSMVCAQTTHKTKTHIHTNNPGQVLEIAIKYGQLNNIKIENMLFQHKNLLISEKEIKDNTKRIYRTTSLKLVEDIQEILLKTGYLSHVTSSYFRDIKMYSINYSPDTYYNKIYFPSNKKDACMIPYKGLVWCLNLKKNGVFLLRRNGNEFFCGNCALQFVEKSIQIAPIACHFLNIRFLESATRRKFFEKHPPRYVCVFSERIPSSKNGLFPKNESSTVCYAWFIWERDFTGRPEIIWI